MQLLQQLLQVASVNCTSIFPSCISRCIATLSHPLCCTNCHHSLPRGRQLVVQLAAHWISRTHKVGKSPGSSGLVLQPRSAARHARSNEAAISRFTAKKHGLTTFQARPNTPRCIMPHLPRASALSAFRAVPQFRAPVNKRFFTPSAYNMTIKAYFDCSWTGPEVQVDNAGNVTKQGEVKGSYFSLPILSHTANTTFGCTLSDADSDLF